MSEKKIFNKYFYGYQIVAAGFVIQMMYLGCVYTFGALFPELEKEFGWSRASISGAASLFFLMFGLFGIIMGTASDRYGPRIVLSLCGAIFAFGFLMIHHVTHLWELYLFYGILGGIGMAAHEVATLSTIARWFSKNRGLMTGIVKSGSGIGQAIVPIIATTLILDFGWRISCIIIGGVSFVVMVLAAQLFRRDPNEVNIDSLNINHENHNQNLKPSTKLAIKAVLKHRDFWILSVSKFADMFCLFTIITHIVPHGIDKGLSQSSAVSVLATIGASSIVGRMFFGICCDRLGQRRALMLCFATLFLSFIILQNLFDSKLFFAFAFVYGVAHGGFFAIAPSSVAEFFGTQSHGMIFGIILFFGTIGGTIGPLVAGRIFDLTQSYNFSFLIITSIAAFGIILAYNLRQPHQKLFN